MCDECRPKGAGVDPRAHNLNTTRANRQSGAARTCAVGINAGAVG
jgi:hypothetical protein